MPYTPKRSRGSSDSDCSGDIASALSRRLVGQPAAIEAIVPYVEMYRAKLTPEGRPAGIFLLLGPTGTGKTKTVEALADVLHGSPKKLLKVDTRWNTKWPSYWERLRDISDIGKRSLC
jgi:ATP-dependent Clp protease ATP-binding subunit ClpA